MAKNPRPDAFVPHEDEQFWEPQDSRPVFDEHVLDRPISRIRLRPAAMVEVGTLIADAIRRMREKRIGSVLVTRNGLLAGIVTERDLMHRFVLGEMDPATTRVEQLMHPDPEHLTPEHPLAYALRAMSQGGFRHIPLVDEQGRPVGIISVRDIVDFLAEIFHEKVVTLPPTPGAAIAPKREGG